MNRKIELVEELEEKKANILELEETIDALDSNQNIEEYENYLNDVYGEIDICGLKYNASFALKCVDEIAFNVGHSDYNDEILTEEQGNLQTLQEEVAELEKELTTLQ